MNTDKVDAREAWNETTANLIRNLWTALYRLGRHNVNPAEPGSLESAIEHNAVLETHLRTQPEGYVLVPVNLTEPLLIAGRDSVTLEHGVDAMLRYAWSQIIDAAQEGK